MRGVKAVLVVTISVLLLGVFALAEQNQFGVSDLYRVSFTDKVRVADTLLPAGNYEIRHTMEGENHIMVFRQLGAKKPVEVRAKCTLVSLPGKAAADKKVFVLNAADERVLHELIFKGDMAKHVF